ncbi:beta-ketoacyl-ACP synthase II [Rubellicoccus peritrichatus]|uniref:3-oxoacyl-[acyl-carrier-protein] synthase 2 n=1 Tax=Rubellicoccus peritrichatus TaxID=3080537 RepID=A0AAQ3L8Y8_9BACT|nr:beta-ketoacyl-ACP synthase II [Puniceicoccus sp. CR14]WOO41286.1 beta-ketoacyl-ACP synthase II [Puniceicoccus sp. CR14]
MQNHQPGSKVVITGLGTLTGAGIGVDDFWDNLCAGRSGIDRIKGFDIDPYPCQVGSEVKDFDPCDYMDRKEVNRNDRYTHYAMGAAKLALKDADLDTTKVVQERMGVIVGSGIGGIETVETQTQRLFNMGPRRVSPFMIPSLIANIASGVIAIEIKAKGPNFAVVSACTTGTHAIGEAMHVIKRGEADIMLAGGTEAAITKTGFAGFCAMRAMSTNFNDEPQRASRPFDEKRDGFVMGDGSGIVVLESEEHAKARGARIYCELVGYATTCDAHHITSPDLEGTGLANCLTNALNYSGVEATEVDYINAHGTSTPYNDRCESAAVKTVLGDHAYKIAMSSTKSMTGHLLGAAGGIEAAVCAKAIQTGIIPPTINYENPDPNCDLDYVPNKAKEATVNVALSNNLGFGGHNATVVLRRYPLN